MAKKQKPTVWQCKTHWMLAESKHVTICKQRMGEQETGLVCMPRKTFDKMVVAYLIAGGYKLNPKHC